MITIYLTSTVRSWIFTQTRVILQSGKSSPCSMDIAEHCMEAKELKERYETLVKSSEAELKKKIENMDIEKQNEAKDAQFAISYAHEASPEIHIEDVFEKLYEEKNVNPTKELSVHTGQFFRVMSTEYIKLYPGTKEMLKDLRRRERMYICFQMRSVYLQPMR